MLIKAIVAAWKAQYSNQIAVSLKFKCINEIMACPFDANAYS